MNDDLKTHVLLSPAIVSDALLFIN